MKAALVNNFNDRSLKVFGTRREARDDIGDSLSGTTTFGDAGVTSGGATELYVAKLKSENSPRQ